MSTQDEALVGRVVADKYRLEKLVARGGFSSVFRGLHLGINRPVAIKVLPINADVQATWIERFSREARVVSQLSHPNTITIFDFGQSAGEFFYIVMEYVRGRSLSRYIKKFGPVPPERAARFATQIARSLDEAHHMGIIHRDLKPSNIMVSMASSGEETIKVLDFGVAKLLEPDPEVDIKLTQIGAFVGTPRYAAPEQLRREELDHRSDIYGLGMIMWEALVGSPAIAATDFGTCLQYHLSPEKWRLPAGLDIPEELADIVHKCLEKERADRYLSCGQLADDLEDFVGQFQYGRTGRMADAAMTMERLEESQELAAFSVGSSESIQSVDSAVIQEFTDDSQTARYTPDPSRKVTVSAAQRTTEKKTRPAGAPVDDDFFGAFAEPSEADQEMYEELSEAFGDDVEAVAEASNDFSAFDFSLEPDQDVDDFLTGPRDVHDGSEAALLDGPAMSSSGVPEPVEQDPLRQTRRRYDSEERRRLERLPSEPGKLPGWEDNLELADVPKKTGRRSSEVARQKRQSDAMGWGRSLGIGAAVIVSVVLGAVVVLHLLGGSEDSDPNVADYRKEAQAEVDKLLASADEDNPAKNDGTPTISAKAILMALNHDGWRSPDPQFNDLGDVQQTSALMRKEEMAASVTIYATKSSSVAEELLADTRSPAEGITFGATLVRVAPGPSNAKSGVTPVVAHLYTFKNIVREEATR